MHCAWVCRLHTGEKHKHNYVCTFCKVS
uniref:Uncharacterized protein n=1 Tax=Anguilla anguilla TaxID=7936 RepID=A0A0E9XT42_ANGAN